MARLSLLVGCAVASLALGCGGKAKMEKVSETFCEEQISCADESGDGSDLVSANVCSGAVLGFLEDLEESDGKKCRKAAVDVLDCVNENIGCIDPANADLASTFAFLSCAEVLNETFTECATLEDLEDLDQVFDIGL